MSQNPFGANFSTKDEGLLFSLAPTSVSALSECVFLAKSTNSFNVSRSVRCSHRRCLGIKLVPCLSFSGRHHCHFLHLRSLLCANVTRYTHYNFIKQPTLPCLVRCNSVTLHLCCSRHPCLQLVQRLRNFRFFLSNNL